MQPIESLAKTRGEDLFGSLRSLMIKFWSDKKLGKADYGLESYEECLLNLVLLKKKCLDHFTYNVTKTSLARIRKKRVKKKNEDMFKFILQKSLKHLKEEYLKSRLEQVSSDRLIVLTNQSYSTKLEREHDFYRFYFQGVSEKMNIPIENFYFYRNKNMQKKSRYKTKFSLNIFALWKLNPEFTDLLCEYIEKEFVNDFIIFNSKKIHLLVNNWKKRVAEAGTVRGFQDIVLSFFRTGGKLPWTVMEVKRACLLCLNQSM